MIGTGVASTLGYHLVETRRFPRMSDVLRPAYGKVVNWRMVEVEDIHKANFGAHRSF